MMDLCRNASDFMEVARGIVEAGEREGKPELRHCLLLRDHGSRESRKNWVEDYQEKHLTGFGKSR